MRHAQFLADLKPLDRERKRHHEMYHIRPRNGVLQHIHFGLSKRHTLCVDKPLTDRHSPLRYHIFVLRLCARRDDTHLVAVAAQMVGETLRRDSCAVVGSIELIYH